MSHSPQLLLLPGLAADERMWRGVLPLLPAALRPAVATAHQDVGLHTIEDFAARLLAQHAGPLVLAGASMGGMIAMEAARQAPERVAGLALLGTTPRPPPPAGGGAGLFPFWGGPRPPPPGSPNPAPSSIGPMPASTCPAWPARCWWYAARLTSSRRPNVRLRLRRWCPVLSTTSCRTAATC